MKKRILSAALAAAMMLGSISVSASLDVLLIRIGQIHGLQ